MTIVTALVVSMPGTAPAQQNELAGVWSGTMGLEASKQNPVRVEFKVDAKNVVTGVVTGPTLAPGDITTGTLDPKTGLLTFTVVVRDGGGTKVEFAGRLVRDAMSGSLNHAGQVGSFKLTKGESKAAPPQADLSAPSPNGEAGAAAKRGFIEVSGWITRAADLVPADKYSYKPVGTVRTFGQLVGHIADAYRFYCGRAASKNVQWGDANEKLTGKPALTLALKQATAECAAAYDATSQIAPLMENIGHSSLHYGNVVTYMRMLGLTPPSS